MDLWLLPQDVISLLLSRQAVYTVMKERSPYTNCLISLLKKKKRSSLN